MRIEPDLWLQGLFGHGVFRVTPSDQVAAEPLYRAAGGQQAFFYAKVPVTEVRRVGILTELGFKVVDVNVTFERQPGGGAPAAAPVRPAEPGDREQVLAIAASCFVYSRFHLDPLVAPCLADQIKRAWVESYLEKKRGDLLLVAQVEGRPVGFLAGLAAAVGGRPAWVIDLMGVDRAIQRQGIGSSLVREFIQLAAGRCEVLSVGTQVANAPSMRLYEGCGFRMAEAAYVLHAHLREGELR